MITESSLLNGVKNIQLILTKNCNFNCKYCFSENGNNIMKYSTLEKLADMLKSYDTSLCNINFFGGEPVLEYNNLIIPFIDRMTQLGYKGNYSIITNGSLLTDDQLDHMIQHKFGIMFSMDGDCETFCKNRNSNKEIFNTIINNIKKLTNINYKKLEVRLTYTKENILDLAKNVEYLYNLGIKKVQIYHEYDIKLDSYQMNILKLQLKDILNFYIKHNDLNIYFIDRLLHHYFNKEKYSRQICSKCGLFNKESFSFSINYDGNFFTCHHFNSIDPKYYDFNIGNINEGFYFDKLNNLLEENLVKQNTEDYLIREKKCSGCVLYTLCSSNCIMQNLKLYNNIFINDTVACNINKLMFEVISETLK